MQRVPNYPIVSLGAHKPSYLASRSHPFLQQPRRFFLILSGRSRSIQASIGSWPPYINVSDWNLYSRKECRFSTVYLNYPTLLSRWPLQNVVGTLSLRIQQLDVYCKTNRKREGLLAQSCSYYHIMAVRVLTSAPFLLFFFFFI